jgi:hypothetical protein
MRHWYQWRSDGCRLSKAEKKRLKKWDRRERSPVPQRTIAPFCHRAARFEEIRLNRLMEEEPDHADLRPWRFRLARIGRHAWMNINFYEDTAYERECGGCIC